MSQPIRIVRYAAIATGAAVLGASAFITITDFKQSISHAVGTGILALAVFVAAVAIGPAFASRRWLLASCLGLFLLAGEGYGLLMTATRVVLQGETEQATVRSASAQHDYAVKEVAKASDGLAGANTAATAKAAEKGCKENCRALLQARVDNATRDLERARALLAANPKPTASGSPLADRVGLAPWIVDLTGAALLAVGTNGLAAALIAFGAHSSSPALPQPANGNEPQAPTPGKRGRRGATSKNPALISFISAFERKHGRKPTVAEMRAGNPNIPRQTIQGYVAADRPVLLRVA